jgi:amidase
MSEELCYLSASAVLEKFRDRSLSPVEYLETSIRRAQRVEPVIHAFAFEYFAEALDKAAQAERAYVQGSARPLEGLPVAIKDEAYIEGKITTHGTLLFENRIADRTTPFVRHLLDAGAIVHARTAIPEFSLTATTSSRFRDPTATPWNPGVTSGGSSGGSGAALAAGTTPLASGSDIGGSVRIPAAMNGVIGFKPPYGRVPGDAPISFDPYAQVGPMARSVADAILMYNTIARPHADDMTVIKPGVAIAPELPPIEGMRLALSFDLGYKKIAADVIRNTEHAADVLRSTGAEVEEIGLKWDDSLSEAFMAHLTCGIMGAIIAAVPSSKHDLLMPCTRAFIERVSEARTVDLFRAEMTAAKTYERMREVFETCDALICPTLATTDVPAGFDGTVDKQTIDGERVHPTLGWLLTYPFNVLNRCPVISVPSGLADNGVPTGLQIVGPPFEDERVFRIAAAFEKETAPFFDRHRPAPIDA